MTAGRKDRKPAKQKALEAAALLSPDGKNLGTGAPLKPIFITATDIQRAAECGNTDDDIALLACISEATLKNRFGDVLAFGRAVRRDRLRTKQTTLAEAGDKTMLIWLGKNGLGQADKNENEETNFDLTTLSTEELASFSSGKPLKRILADRTPQ